MKLSTKLLSFGRDSEVELVEEGGPALLQHGGQRVEGVVDGVMEAVLLVAQRLARGADGLDALPDGGHLVLEAGHRGPHGLLLRLHGRVEAAAATVSMTPHTRVMIVILRSVSSIVSTLLSRAVM